MLAILWSVVAEAQIAQVKQVVGSATLVRGTTTPVEAGTLIEPNDLLITQAASYLSLTFIDESRITVGPRTRFRITYFNFNPTVKEGTLKSEMTEGKVVVSSGSTSMHVQTPRAAITPAGKTAITVGRQK